MAQLTTSFTEIGRANGGNNGYGYYPQIVLLARYYEQSIAGNYTNIELQLVARMTGGTARSGSVSSNLDGTGASHGTLNLTTSNVVLQTVQRTIHHNNDGTSGTISKGASMSGYWDIFNVSVSGSFTLPTIPRYASITSFSVSKVDETSVKYSFSANATLDYAWYSTNGGSSWANLPVNNTITGLSAGTSYNFKLRVRRKDSQLTTDSSTVNQSTYNYPYVEKVGSNPLTIGNSQTLTLYNPLKRNCTVKMFKDSTSGKQIYSGTTSGTSITFTPTASTLYDLIPNSQSGNCVYSVTYGSSTKTTGTNTFKIKGTEKPSFSNFTFKDINSTTIGLTDNDQILVNDYSNCEFTISTANKATAQNSSSISKYVINWGSASKDVSYSSSADVSGSVIGSGNVLKITAIDSRGLSTTITKNITNIIYSKSSVNSLSTERKNGIEAITYLQTKVSLWGGKWDNSSRSNDLIYIGYRTKQKSSSTWTSYYDITSKFKQLASKSTDNNVITYDLSDNTLEIHSNGSSGGFTIGSQYDIEILIRDGYGTYYVYSANGTAIITDGKVCMDRYKNSDGNYHIGINGMADENYNMNVHGSGNFSSLSINGTKVLEYTVVDTW